MLGSATVGNIFDPALLSDCYVFCELEQIVLLYSSFLYDIPKIHRAGFDNTYNTLTNLIMFYNVD